MILYNARWKQVKSFLVLKFSIMAGANKFAFYILGDFNAVIKEHTFHQSVRGLYKFAKIELSDKATDELAHLCTFHYVWYDRNLLSWRSSREVKMTAYINIVLYQDSYCFRDDKHEISICSVNMIFLLCCGYHLRLEKAVQAGYCCKVSFGVILVGMK